MTGFDRGLLTGLAAFRWVAWAWFAIVLVVERDDLDRPAVAATLCGAALVVTAGIAILFRRRPELLLSPVVVVTELLIGALVLAADDFVYDDDRSQSFGSAWPLSGVTAAGVAGGPVGGTIAGATLGFARYLGHLDDSMISLVSTAVLYALAGGAQGLAAQRLREAELTISAARAREEVARTLHDGVLQTLAIVQRRANDPELARLAHDQERDLREYLFGTGIATGAGGGLGQRLRAAGARFEDHYGGAARIVVADDLPDLPGEVVDALAGAVSEALANAGKHGDAKTVTVYVEPDGDSVFCSVKDDGTGYDPAATSEGVGVTRSIRGRIAEVGGRVELDARPGRGAEVRLWIPALPFFRRKPSS
jgi:signal transduction histidine kinase